MTTKEALFIYSARLADDSLILSHRLSEWCGHGPILEEDIAMTNIALDLLGQATSFFEYAGEVEDKGRTADDIAFLRLEREYTNCLLVEQPNGDFGKTMIRQFLFDVYHFYLFQGLTSSKDVQLAAIAEKSLKEVTYHLKHSSEWVVRLGDGTDESHQRVQEALNTLWRFTGELFDMDTVDELMIKEGIGVDLAKIKLLYDDHVKDLLGRATLSIPDNNYMQKGGRKGVHSEHLGFLLTELQYMQRTYPGMTW
ncbi:MAG: 1,2-phenylacetyl-CoA epoxidase subunit PaaC [Crocinitomicaceae bacterium]